MNLLMVDDDRYVLEGLMNGISWDLLPVDNVLKARGSIQAKEIMDAYHIHVMICDIEMPQGSGLDLVEWMRSQGYRTQVIFLTSYATFDYARRALTLQSYEYLLKPVDYDKLTEVIKLALGKVAEDERQQEYITYGQYWLESRADYKELYWTKVLRRGQPLDSLGKGPEGYRAGDLIQMLQARIERKDQAEEALDSAMFEYGIRKAFEECFQDTFPDVETVFVDDRGIFTAVFLLQRELPVTVLTELAIQFCQRTGRRECCDIAVYIPEATPLNAICRQLDSLRRLQYEYVCFHNGVFTWDMHMDHSLAYKMPDTQRIEQYFYEGQADKIRFYLLHEMDGRVRQERFGPEDMQNFIIDVMQLIFAILKENNIDAHMLFSTPENRELYKKALNGYEEFRAYLSFLVDTSIDYMNKMKQTEDVISQAIEYMKGHLNEEITRNTLAKLLYLNPDYIGKLFKKRTGESIVHYMTRLRLESASRQILQTNRPVNDIAQEVGFATVSYFAKKFRELYGVNPSEYREIRVAETGALPQKQQGEG